MKTSFLLFGVSLLLAWAATAADTAVPEPRDWSSVLQSDQGQYSVSVQPTQKRVEVRKISGAPGTPPHLRVRVLRENDRALELKLKTLDAKSPSPVYTGQLPQWRDSYVGLEVDISFDKKTWKRLGKILRKAVP